ncbi:MAG: sulfurtransferase TusA family protein [Bacillota bacterium]
MSAAMSLYQLPASLSDDLEQLRQMIEQFKTGAIPAARFQAFRVPQGIYEQRESGTYMLRMRLPAGMFLPQHMRAVAEVAEKYGNGTLHLTSRQDIQVHRVPLEGVYPAVLALAEAGLSTKGGGGNTVRNIAACPHAGVCRKEVFDVTPHVIGLTEFMLPDPVSFQLPRKYKIAFSGCSQDCAGATINDLGFISKEHDGVQGFAVYVAGGMGASSRVGKLLEEFIPVTVAPRVAEAIKRVFDKHGNRKNKHRARIRFLAEDLGFEKFRELYRAELEQLKLPPATVPAAFVAPVPSHATSEMRGAPIPVGFEQWCKASVTAQKQPGRFIVEITPPLGVIESGPLRQLATIVEAHGERMLRATNTQGMVLRWVAEGELPVLYAELLAIGLAGSQPGQLRRLVVCAGASTCRLGICLSRGLASAIGTALNKSGLDLRDGTGDVAVNISGCPNACGRHPVGQIGLCGAARRINGHLVPHYILQLGGHVEEGKTVLASGSLAIPARNVPAFLVDFFTAFQTSPQHPDFEAFLRAGGIKTAERLAHRHATVPEFAEDKNPYYDWGGKELFSLAGRGPGECGAGVFDLIEVDLASAAEALNAGRLFAATALTARALLVTRGEQADDHLQALSLFRKHFVEANLIPANLHGLVFQAARAATEADAEEAFRGDRDQVNALLAEVKRIYEGMGPSLRMPAPACSIAPTPTSSVPPNIKADLAVDYRGVSCPLNYVKTKMALGKLKGGQVLSVLLDEQGAKNVPASAANDGHAVVSIGQEDGHWRVVLRKGA